MRIERALAFIVEVPYKQPYVIAPGRVETARRVIVQLIADDGSSGFGETGVTIPERGGEIPEAILASLQRMFLPITVGRDPREVARVIRDMGNAHWGKTGYLCAKTAIDNAMYDLAGRAIGCSAATLLGGQLRDRVTVSRSLGVGAPDAVAKQAHTLQAHGYATLTVKVGFDPVEDLVRVRAVREAVGPDFPLEVDVNEGYTAAEAVRTLTKMQDECGIAAVEQPCAWWDLDGMAKVADALTIPVIADESAWHPQDVYKLAKAGAADEICIKIIKNGGLYLSQKIAAVAEAVGMPVSLGSKHPLGPGTAAILQFACSIPNVRLPVGYGTPSERLTDDIIADDLVMENGTVALPSGPGLGVELDPEKVTKYWTAGDRPEF